MLLGERDDAEVVLIGADSGAVVTVAEVRVRAQELRAAAADRGLAFLTSDNSLRCVVDFLSVLEAGIPVALVDQGRR